VGGVVRVVGTCEECVGKGGCLLVAELSDFSTGGREHASCPGDNVPFNDATAEMEREEEVFFHIIIASLGGLS
jgi:hypothetical protein